MPRDIVPSIWFPLQANGIPGGQGAGHRRQEPKDIVEAQARDRQRPSRERHEEDAVEEERDRREEPVSVGVAGEGERGPAPPGREVPARRAPRTYPASPP